MLKLWSKICLGIFAVLFVVSESFAITGSGGASVTVTPDWITDGGSSPKTVVNFRATYTATTSTITCSAGTYFNGTTCSTTCPQKYYCPGGDYTSNGEIQGRYACPSDYPNSAAGNTSKNKCYKSCTPQTGHSVTGMVYYDNTNTCTYTPNTYIDLNTNGGSGGTTRLYTVYNTGVYLDAARTQAMSTTANPIEVPTGGTVVKVTFNPSGGKCNGTSGPSYNQAYHDFDGYYSGGTQYITNGGYITSDGLTAAKRVSSYGAYWTAQWGKARVSAPGDCERTGYTFAGWYSQTGGQGTSYGSSTVSTQSDITVYAHWTPITYTITLDDNGGSGGSGTAKEVYNTKWTNSSNSTITYVTVPTLSGYAFKGYYTAKTGGNLVIPADGKLPANTTFTSATTLYARWSVNAYTIGFSTNGGSGGTTTLYTVYNTGVYLDAAHTQAMSTNANPITKPTGPAVDVTFDPNGGNHNGSTGTVKNTVGRAFNGYYSSSSSSTQYITNSGYITSDGLDAAKSVASNGAYWTAQWGKASVSAPVTFTRTGYTFVGWNSKSDGTGTNYGTGAISTASNITVYAQWTANCNEVFISVNWDGGDTGATVYKKSGTAEYFSDASCKTSITGLATSALPTKANATFSGTTNGCVLASGALNPSAACFVAGDAVWDAVFTCNEGYDTTSGSMACTAVEYDITYDCGDGYYGTSTSSTGTDSATFGESYTIPIGAYCRHSTKPFGGWNFPSN